MTQEIFWKPVSVRVPPRLERRKIAQNVVQQVRAKGISQASTKSLQEALYGVVTQDQMEGLQALDERVLQELQRGCQHEGRFYEDIRRELARRASQSTSTKIAPFSQQKLPPFDKLQWTTEEQKEIQSILLQRWQTSHSKKVAMHFAIVCMPLPVWHWRLYLWHYRKILTIIDSRLYSVTLRTAGRVGRTCCEEGLSFIESEATKRLKDLSDCPSFAYDPDPWGDGCGECSELEAEGIQLWRKAFPWER